MRDLLVVDLETSGFDRSRHHILEVGAVVLRASDLQEVRSYSAAVHYDSHDVAVIRASAGDGALAISGWDGPPPDAVRLDDVFRRLSALPAGPAVLVGHNVEFDRGFLLADWRRNMGGAPPDWLESSYHTLDTRHLAWPLVRAGLVESRSLSTLCALWGIPRPEPHRALDDARATAEVLRRLVRRDARIDELEQRLDEYAADDINGEELAMRLTEARDAL